MHEFHRTIEALRERLAEPLPGPKAHMRMAPERPGMDNRHIVEGRDCRQAAVLIVLLPRDGKPHVLMTLRRGHLAQHAGQVSFPGGGRDEGEHLLATALREAQEEVNLNPADIEVLGPLSPLFIPPSNYCVYPFLAYAESEPLLTPHDFEVERILHVPLETIAQESTARRDYRVIRGQKVLVPFYHIESLEIWGATAMMLSELLSLLE